MEELDVRNAGLSPKSAREAALHVDRMESDLRNDSTRNVLSTRNVRNPQTGFERDQEVAQLKREVTKMKDELKRKEKQLADQAQRSSQFTHKEDVAVNLRQQQNANKLQKDKISEMKKELAQTKNTIAQLQNEIKEKEKEISRQKNKTSQSQSAARVFRQQLETQIVRYFCGVFRSNIVVLNAQRKWKEKAIFAQQYQCSHIFSIVARSNKVDIYSQRKDNFNSLRIGLWREGKGNDNQVDAWKRYAILKIILHWQHL